MSHRAALSAEVVARRIAMVANRAGVSPSAAREELVSEDWSVEHAVHNLRVEGSGYLIPRLSRDELRMIRVALVDVQSRAAAHMADCHRDGYEQEAAHYRAEHARYAALLDRLPTLRHCGE